MSELVFKLNKAKSDLLRPAYDRMHLVEHEQAKAGFELRDLADQLVDGPEEGNAFHTLIDRFVHAKARHDALGSLHAEMRKIITEAEGAS